MTSKMWTTDHTVWAVVDPHHLQTVLHKTLESAASWAAGRPGSVVLETDVMKEGDW